MFLFILFIKLWYTKSVFRTNISNTDILKYQHVAFSHHLAVYESVKFLFQKRETSTNNLNRSCHGIYIGK